MYNGIGLATPRGSGTNGHVQRNWALVKPRVKEKTYKSEQELATLDTATNRQPNKEILDHERKRKIELKCAEFADILEEQGFCEETINNKVNNYRKMLMGQGGKLDKPIDQWGRPCVTETHQVAEAQQEKNARLREAFGISEYFVDGSSFDPDRQAKEKLAKSIALLEKEKQEVLAREKAKELEKAEASRYQLVHTPSPEPPQLPINENNTKKKKRKHRNSSSSEETKKKKKKKNHKKDRSGKVKEKKKKKKHKKEDFSEKSSTSGLDLTSEDERKKKSTKKEKRKMPRKRKHSSSEFSKESSPEPNKKLSGFSYKTERNKLRNDKNLKTELSYDLYTVKPKTSSRSDEKHSNYMRSRSPVSRRNCSRRSISPYNDSREASYDELSRSKKLLTKSRSRSREIRRKSKSRSSEAKDSKTISPEMKQKTKEKNVDEDYKGKNKKHFNKSNSKLAEKFRKSRSRSLGDDSKQKNNKSVSYEKRSRSERSKSPKRSRSQSSNKKLKVEIYCDKKTQKEKLTDIRLEELSECKNKRKSPASPTYERKRRKSSSPKRDKSESRNQSFKITRHRRSSSPSHSDIKRLNSPKTNVNRNSTANNNESAFGHENSVTYEKSKYAFSSKCHGSKLSSSRENSTEREIDFKNKEWNLSHNKSQNANRDENLEKNCNDNETKQETCKSLTPDYKFHSMISPTGKCKSRSNSPDIKRSLKQKDLAEKHFKSKKPLPVVRLRTSSNEPESSDNDFEKEEEEDDKEVKILKLLKTDLAAKAKESLERKKEKPPSPKHVIRRQIEPDLFDIKVLPLKIEKEKSQDLINKDDFDIERNASADNFKFRSKSIYSRIRSKSRSRSSSHSSASSKNCQRSKSSSSCSTHSPSRSRTVSRSRSRSSSISNSSESSSTSRSRSPSIPRRHGSPSFLDRRRITRHK